MQPQRFAIADGKLLLDWDDLQIALDGNRLRSRCRCAECRYLLLTAVKGAVEDSPAIDAENSLSTATAVTALSPLGYGVQLHFSDGHNRGVFPWRYLYEIAHETAGGIAAAAI